MPPTLTIPRLEPRTSSGLHGQRYTDVMYGSVHREVYPGWYSREAYSRGVYTRVW